MCDTEFVRIGKGMCRLTVRSKAKRLRLARIPGVQVSGSRVIFPEWISGNIGRILYPAIKRKKPEPEQIELFPR